METARTEGTLRKPLRLWPGVLIVALQWLLWLGLPLVAPEQAAYAIIAGVAAGPLVILWWLFFSRAPWLERLGAVVLIVAAMAATPAILHKSIATGMMGMMFYLYAIPVICLALVVWAAAGRGFTTGARRVSMAAAIVIACGGFALLRSGGITGDVDADLMWRWAQTPEERLLARGAEEPSAIASAPDAAAVAAWPGFRGPGRDGVVRGVHISTDWSASPPAELWRRPIGPGWSSFAVQDGLFYTQEQRGDEEIVSCHELDTGQPVWRHSDPARFWESNAGAGPRATPTLSGGRVYTLGATGILNALDAADGSVVWSRNAASDTGVKVPGWGFAGSPLVVGDTVVVATSGKLAAYHLETGQPRWFGPEGGWGYSSPQLASIGGVAQILLMNGAGAIGVAPEDGTLLWKHEWPGDGIVQPALTPEGDVLIGTGSGLGSDAKLGVVRVALERQTGGWSAQQRWETIALKPYFNDFVLHKGHAYGFDGGILACVDLANGKRKWKGGRYGHGQLILLADQDLLLVLSERGDLAVVTATPDGFKELAQSPAIKGKTWNHPALVGDTLLVRNGQEMAAFRLKQ